MSEDKRQNEIIRIQKKRNNFVMLDKGFLEDSRLSYKAKGILAYLLSKPDNWKVIVKDLITHSSDGKKAIYSGLRELKEYGYYKKIPIRNEKGQRISHWESVIFECPEEKSYPPDSEPEVNSEKTLFTPNGEIDETIENTAPSLFTPFVHIENVQIQNEEIQNGQRNNNYINNNYSTNIKSESSQRQTEEANNQKSDETLTNDIDSDNMKKLELSEIKKELPETATPTKANGLRSTYTERHFSTNDYNTYLNIIQDNIDYDHYLSFKNTDIDLVDELIDCMLDVICTDGDTVKIGSEDKSRSMVISQFLKLNSMDIEHVIERYKEQRHKITHINNYLKTMLYTVRQESEHYYINAVRADGVIH